MNVFLAFIQLCLSESAVKALALRSPSYKPLPFYLKVLKHTNTAACTPPIPDQSIRLRIFKTTSEEPPISRKIRTGERDRESKTEKDNLPRMRLLSEGLCVHHFPS